MIGNRTTALAIVLSWLAIGCAPGVRSYGPFVREINLVGDILVVEKCRFRLSGEEMTLDNDSCWIERQRLPGIPPDKLTSKQVLAVLTPLRAQLRDCGLRHSVEGVARLRLVINPRGEVTAATPHVGSAEFAGCIRDVFARRRFPQSIEGVTVTYPITIPPATPPAPAEPTVPSHCEEPLRQARAEPDPERRYELLRHIPPECFDPRQR